MSSDSAMPQPNPEILLTLARTAMPFGRYKGRLLIDLPEPYVRVVCAPGLSAYQAGSHAGAGARNQSQRVGASLRLLALKSGRLTLRLCKKVLQHRDKRRFCAGRAIDETSYASIGRKALGQPWPCLFLQHAPLAEGVPLR